MESDHFCIIVSFHPTDCIRFVPIKLVVEAGPFVVGTNRRCPRSSVPLVCTGTNLPFCWLVYAPPSCFSNLDGFNSLKCLPKATVQDGTTGGSIDTSWNRQDDRQSGEDGPPLLQTPDFFAGALTSTRRVTFRLVVDRAFAHSRRAAMGRFQCDFILQDP